MKLVTPFKKSIKMLPEYVPGKCNIGARGRAIRLFTGLGIIAVFIGFDLLALGSASPVFRFFLFIPFYVGLLTAFSGTLSFCVLEASRGSYDLHESSGMASAMALTRMAGGSGGWAKMARR